MKSSRLSPSSARLWRCCNDGRGRGGCAFPRPAGFANDEADGDVSICLLYNEDGAASKWRGGGEQQRVGCTRGGIIVYMCIPTRRLYTYSYLPTFVKHQQVKKTHDALGKVARQPRGRHGRRTEHGGAKQCRKIDA